MTKYFGLAIDPGMSNGLCVFSWGDEEPFQQEALYQLRGGAVALRAFLVANDFRMSVTKVPHFQGHIISALVVERFTPRSHEGFSLTLPAVEPLRCEGVLIGLGAESVITWQNPSAQYFMGGADLTDRKKRARQFLKDNGISATGKMVGQPDADDALSAELHAIAYLRKIRHRPTLEELFTDEGEE